VKLVRVETWTVAVWTVKAGREEEFIATWTPFLD
jgi:hypothetical protein